MHASHATDADAERERVYIQSEFIV